MSIVARFPLKSTCNSSTGHKEQKKIIIEEPEDDISWQGKMQRGAASDLEFFNLRGAHTEEKKTGHSTKSSGSNIGGSIDEWKNFPIYVNSITGHNPLEAKEQEERITKGAIDEWKNSFCVYQPTSHLSNTQLHNTPSSDYFRHVTLNTVEKVKGPEARQTESRFYLPSNASKFAATKEMETLDSRVIPTAETIKPQQASSTNTATASMDNAYLPSRKQLKHPLISEQQEARFQTHQGSFNELQRSREEIFQHQDISVKNTRNLVRAQAQRGSRMQSTLEKSLEISNREMRISLEDRKIQMVCKVSRPNQKEQVHSSDKVSMETTINAMKGTRSFKKWKGFVLK